MGKLVADTMNAVTRGEELSEMDKRIQRNRNLEAETKQFSEDLYKGVTEQNEQQLSEITFQQKLKEIEEFLWEGTAQQNFLPDNLPLPTIQPIVIEQINSLLHNRTKNNSTIEINTRGWLKILKNKDTDFKITYHEETNNNWETSQKIRFNDKLYTEVKKRKNFDLSYNITNNEIEIDGKRYSLTEEQWKTMLNAIYQMITATEGKYKDQRRNKASR